jgi:hypothetical protein
MTGGGGRPPFMGPRGNLPIGVSEIRTCLARRPHISEKRYLNSVLATYMSDAPRLNTREADWLDMSGPGIGYVQGMPLEPR